MNNYLSLSLYIYIYIYIYTKRVGCIGCSKEWAKGDDAQATYTVSSVAPPAFNVYTLHIHVSI